MSVSTNHSLDGTYTVTWTSPPSAFFNCRFEERVNRGAWVTISTACRGSKQYSGKPIGDYEYRRGIYTSGVRVSPDPYEVGVLAGVNLCPDGREPLEIFFDNEDRYTNDPYGRSQASGWTGASFVDSEYYNTTLKICRVSGQVFKPLIGYPAYPQAAYEWDYSVLKLGPQCPPGSAEFGHFVDNEDDKAASLMNGLLWPNYLDSHRNAMLRFCIFRYSGPEGVGVMPQQPGAENQFPPLGVPYGVFAGASFLGGDLDGGMVNGGSIYMADEDYQNASYWETYAIDPYAIGSGVGGLGLLGDVNFCTRFHVRQVTSR